MNGCWQLKVTRPIRAPWSASANSDGRHLDLGPAEGEEQSNEGRRPVAERQHARLRAFRCPTNL